MVSTRRVTNNFYVLLLFHILTLPIFVRTPITPHPPNTRIHKMREITCMEIFRISIYRKYFYQRNVKSEVETKIIIS